MGTFIITEEEECTYMTILEEETKDIYEHWDTATINFICDPETNHDHENKHFKIVTTTKKSKHTHMYIYPFWKDSKLKEEVYAESEMYINNVATFLNKWWANESEDRKAEFTTGLVMDPKVWSFSLRQEFFKWG